MPILDEPYDGEIEYDQDLVDLLLALHRYVLDLPAGTWPDHVVADAKTIAAAVVERLNTEREPQITRTHSWLLPTTWPRPGRAHSP